MNLRQNNDFAGCAELAGPVMGRTTTRSEWFDRAMLSAATGKLVQVGANNNTDLDFAKEQEMPEPIANGMSNTN